MKVVSDIEPDQQSGFSTLAQVFRPRPGAPARYPFWSRSTAYEGIASRRFVPPHRVGSRVFFDSGELAIQDRLIRLAGNLEGIDLPRILAEEVIDFHFSIAGLSAIAEALPVGDLKDEATALSTECFWLHDSIEAAREARNKSAEAA